MPKSHDTTGATAPKLKEIASRINAHLKRFEADPVINAGYIDARRKGLHPYYLAGAWSSGNRAYVSYVNYQGSSSLTKADAIAYLAWLDAGNVGTHWRAPEPVDPTEGR